MRILAFHAGPHDVSAAVFDDYDLIAAVQEERLNRRKGAGGFVPWLAIDEALRIAGWSRHDVDAVVATRSFFPLSYFRFPLHKEIDYAVRRWAGKPEPFRDAVAVAQRANQPDTLQVFRSDRFLGDNGFRGDCKFSFINHHEAHALGALFFTDWPEALIYTSDGVGDNVSYSVRTFRDGQLTCQFGDDRWLSRRHREYNSLAAAYGFATTACGFQSHRHEGKLTGLAAFGTPTLADELKTHFRLRDGLVTANFRSEPHMGAVIADICKDHSRENIAASIQQVVEDITLGAVQYQLQQSGARHLALAGGLFANVRLNRLLAEQTPIDEIFIFPAMGDDGLSVGAGLCLLRERDGMATWLGHRRRLQNVYLGRDYDAAIDTHLGASPAVIVRQGDPADVASDLIVAGQAGAIYAGRMEFGPRALGARSIIGNPADATINDRLNKRLQRTEFMPFAPAVLAEDAGEIFEIGPVNEYAARFMTITCAVRPNWRLRIPAVVHVDGTARPQIVHDADNPLYAAILRRFRDKSGLPVLINTSFNVHEEPIVNRPEECLRALLDGRVDFIVTNKAVYVKRAN
jgi:carbamoyltransferase